MVFSTPSQMHPYSFIIMEISFFTCSYTWIIENPIAQVQCFIDILARIFNLKDLITLHYFLRVEAISCSAGLCLSQQKYILDLLVKTNMHATYTVSTPLALSDSLTLRDGSYATLYLHAIGSINIYPLLV